MLNLYIRLVKAGRMEIDEVDADYRDAVRKAVEADK